MLQIINGPQIKTDDYCINHKENGRDELSFSISLSDPAYPVLNEETQILETTENQRYIVKKISAGSSSAAITGQLDLAEWQRDVFLSGESDKPGFSHELEDTDMLQLLITSSPALRPMPHGGAGWAVISRVVTHKRRKIEMAGPNALDVVLQMQKTFGCAFRFDTIQRRVTILYPEEAELSGAYAVETVNLREAPGFRGSSADLYTRLYPIGKDGLTVESVNGGQIYVECYDYTDRVISRIWRDERYTDAETLLADAQERVSTAARPVRSWQLRIVDLYRIDPERWPDMSLDVNRKIRLVDVNKKTSEDVVIREDRIYPEHPENSVITVSTCTETVQRTLAALVNLVRDPNSELWQKLDARSRGGTS